jgi:hypothetical protein
LARQERAPIFNKKIAHSHTLTGCFEALSAEGAEPISL